MTDQGRKIGVVLLNMGGPERVEDVEPFLFNLFSDRRIIRLGPRLLQRPIAWFIARRRAPRSRENYRLIGGGSPLTRFTRNQGMALEKRLTDHGDFTVAPAMRYWHPRAAETLHHLHRQAVRHLVALTLYPHYSRATTGSSLLDLREAAAAFAPGFTIGAVESWPDHPGYIDSLAASILESTAKFESRDIQVVYSAHSLPKKFVEEGDPYADHLQRTIRAVEARTNLTGRLCYQSRSGPVEWLTPSTPEMLATLKREGCRNLLMVPLSFVSDHIETLYEIDILYRNMARDLGMRLERTESLNLRPAFIESLKDLVLTEVAAQGWGKAR